jgi:hypothetical protein
VCPESGTERDVSVSCWWPSRCSCFVAGLRLYSLPWYRVRLTYGAPERVAVPQTVPSLQGNGSARLRTPEWCWAYMCFQCVVVFFCIRHLLRSSCITDTLALLEICFRTHTATVCSKLNWRGNNMLEVGETANGITYATHLCLRLKFFLWCCSQAVRMKMAVFWGVAPCSLVEIDRRIRGVYYVHDHAFISLMMEAISTCGTSLSFQHTARRHVPEDSHLRMSCVVRKLFTCSDGGLCTACRVGSNGLLQSACLHQIGKFCSDATQCRGLLSSKKPNEIPTASRHTHTRNRTLAVADLIKSFQSFRGRNTHWQSGTVRSWRCPADASGVCEAMNVENASVFKWEW